MKLDSTNIYFPQIDALRFFAVVGVLISHWLSDSPINVINPGKLGVDLFFVISGFLITRILLNLKDRSFSNFHKWKIFMIRRILRIFPVYYFVVLITFIFNRGVFEDALWWNLAYCSNLFIIDINKWPGTMSHFWTLSVEEHFYIIWPLLILFTRKHRVLFPIAMMIGVGLLSRMVFFTTDLSYLYGYIFTTSCFDTFAIGGLLAFLFEHENKEFWGKIVRNKILIAISIICLIITYAGIFLSATPTNIWIAVFFRFVSGVAFFFLIGNVIYSKSSILNNKKLVFLGKLSYSMYLLHNFIPGFLMGLHLPENDYLRFPILLAVLIPASYISWRFIEMPFNKLKRHFSYGERK